MLRGLKTKTLGTAALDVRQFKGRAYVHVARGAATGNLVLSIEHSDDGTTWTATGAGAVAFPAGTVLTGAEATAEILVDKYKRYIRKATASVGDVAVLVAKSDGY